MKLINLLTLLLDPGKFIVNLSESEKESMGLK